MFSLFELTLLYTKHLLGGVAKVSCHPPPSRYNTLQSARINKGVTGDQATMQDDP
jgi:hypothetical protein